jgi:hypothetical protein
MAQTFPMPQRRRARTAAIALFLVAGVLSITVPIQAAHVRQAYGTWALWPGAHTPRLPFHGRDYLRANTSSVIPVDATVSLGAAPGNGEIFSRPPITGASPTVLFVRYPDGTVTVYALSGGP